MDLLTEWAAWVQGSAPYILEADRAVLFNSSRSEAALVTTTSWQDAYSAKDFGVPKDQRLLLGLLPLPFLGDLRQASDYILMLNPGLGPHDYYGEYEVQPYRIAIINSLKQEFPGGSIPFLHLDPQYSWHGGFRYWHGKFARIIEWLATNCRLSWAEARTCLGHQVACIELLPYHSASFRDAGGWVKGLRSVALAKSYVKAVVLPRVQSDQATMIVLRSSSAWDLSNQPLVVTYSAQ